MSTSEQARVTTALYRAKKAGKQATLTLREWEISIKDFNGLCAYCEQRPYKVLEHFKAVYVDGTHVKNCVPACYDCNRIKSDASLDEAAAIFGQDVIKRIQSYLETRFEIPEEAVSESKAHPHSVNRWSTRKKTTDQIRSVLPDQEIYSIDELFDFLTCSLVDLASLAKIHIKTLRKIQYSERARRDIILKLLQAFSEVYGKPLSLRNVTGINVQVNKRLEKKEAKSDAA